MCHLRKRIALKKKLKKTHRNYCNGYTTLKGYCNGTLCREQPETLDHLFVHCNKSQAVRRAVNRRWDVLPDNCDNLHDLCGVERTTNQPSPHTLIKDAILQAYCWEVWKGRNEAAFNCKSFISLAVANDIQSGCVLLGS